MHKVIILALISTLMAIWGCGADNTFTQPDHTILRPGEYNSVDDVMTAIRSITGTTSGITRAHPIHHETPSRMAPPEGCKKLGEKSKNIDPDKGGEIELKIKHLEEEVRFLVPPHALDSKTKIQMSVFVAEEIEKILKDNKDDKDDGDENDGLELEIITQMYFEFQPSGTTFTPCAQLVIPFELLLSEDVDTFTIVVTEDDEEDRTEAEDVSYDIDEANEQLIAYVPHFSQYYFMRR